MFIGHKLQKLSNELSLMGFDKEALDITELANNNALDNWQAVLDEVASPGDVGISKASALIFPALEEAGKFAQQILQYDPKDIQMAVEVSKEVPISKGASSNEVMVKLSQNSSTVWGLVQKFGKGVLRILPIVGFIISFGFAFKNFVYGAVTLADILQSEGIDSLKLNCGKLNSRICTLHPSVLADAVQAHKDDPHGLKILASVTKKSRYFADEAISFGANFIDFIKDLIFTIPDIIALFGGAVSAGTTWGVVGIDIGLSLLFMLIEYKAESAALPLWDQSLAEIKTIAESKIYRLKRSFDPRNELFQKQYTDEELREWWQSQMASV